MQTIPTEYKQALKVLAIKELQQVERVVEITNQKRIGRWIQRLNFLLPKQRLNGEKVITRAVPIRPHSERPSSVLFRFDKALELVIQGLQLFGAPKNRFSPDAPDTANPLAAGVKTVEKLVVEFPIAFSAGMSNRTKVAFPGARMRIYRLQRHRNDMIHNFAVGTAINA